MQGLSVSKRNKKQYGKLPPKKPKSKFWDILCVVLIGQYQFTPKRRGKKYQMATKNLKNICLQVVTMIDPATGWIEVCMLSSACAYLVSIILEPAWLTRYLLPSKVIVDSRNKCSSGFKTRIKANYGITVKPITSRNQQANSILESVHQAIVS